MIALNVMSVLGVGAFPYASEQRVCVYCELTVEIAMQNTLRRRTEGRREEMGITDQTNVE